MRFARIDCLLVAGFLVAPSSADMIVYDNNLGPNATLELNPAGEVINFDPLLGGMEVYQVSTLVQGNMKRPSLCC